MFLMQKHIFLCIIALNGSSYFNEFWMERSEATIQYHITDI